MIPHGPTFFLSLDNPTGRIIVHRQGVDKKNFVGFGLAIVYIYHFHQ
jgi:hypothetical protein